MGFKRRRGRPHNVRVRRSRQTITHQFLPGDEVEFLSSDGTWKRGVVAVLRGTFFPLLELEHKDARSESTNVRIRVGDGVWVMRPTSKCRRAGP